MQFSNFLFPESKLPDTDSWSSTRRSVRPNSAMPWALTSSGWQSTTLMAAAPMSTR